MVAALRLATLNLFNNPHGRWSDREALVHEQAVALDADVLAFQECDLEGAQVDRLLGALGPSYSAVRLPNPDSASIKSLAIVTRVAVEGDDACIDLGARDIAPAGAPRRRARGGDDAPALRSVAAGERDPGRAGAQAPVVARSGRR